MKTIARRLHKLEERLTPAADDAQTTRLRSRLESARLRCGLPPLSAERQDNCRGMSLVEILNAGRRRAALGHT